MVEWDTRDAVITNWQDGSVAFEQKDVEFPTDWSLNASNIVTQKYFWGAAETEDREKSLKDLLSRVVNQIVSWAITKVISLATMRRVSLLKSWSHYCSSRKHRLNLQFGLISACLSTINKAVLASYSLLMTLLIAS